MSNKRYNVLNTNKLPNSEIELEIEIAESELLKVRPKALKKYNDSLDIQGFRKGHIPENIIVSKVGELGIREEAADMLLREMYAEIVLGEQIKAIGHPQITITKIAPGSALEIKIKVALYPKVDLADYKSIARKSNLEKKDEQEVKEEDVDKFIEEVRRNKFLADKRKEDPKFDGKVEEKDLPVFDENFVKTLGEFKDVADFREKIKSSLAEENKRKTLEKKRIDTIEKIVEESKIEMPEIVVESELDKMEAQFKYEVERAGGKVEDYLKHIEKTLEELRKEWRKDAEKKSKVQVIFNEIINKEKLAPTPEEIEKETQHLLSHHKDANPDSARSYVTTLLGNEKVFKFLEEQK